MTQRNGSGATDYSIYDEHWLCGHVAHQNYSVSGKQGGGQGQPDRASASAAIEFARLAIAPAEHVLVYGSEDVVTLRDVGVEGKTPYFASDGYLVDFFGKRLPGSQILAALPVDVAKFGETLKWPPAQREPFDQLPVDVSDLGFGFARNSSSC
jgi:hypothetical protein